MAIRRFSTAEPGVKSNKFWDQDTAQGAMVPIANATIISGINYITFTGIPQGYQDLRIVCRWKSLYTGANQDGFWVASGNVASGDYYSTSIRGNGSSVSSSRTTGYYGAYLGDIPANNSTSLNGIFGTATIDILNYTSSSKHKTALARIACDMNGSGQTWLSVGALKTNTPLDTVTVFNYNGGSNASFGSTATLYGIKAGA
jgi:hypothetical protein